MITRYVLEIREHREDGEQYDTWWRNGERGFIHNPFSYRDSEIGGGIPDKKIHSLEDAQEIARKIQADKGWFATFNWEVIIVPLNEDDEYEICS